MSLLSILPSLGPRRDSASQSASACTDPRLASRLPHCRGLGDIGAQSVESSYLASVSDGEEENSTVRNDKQRVATRPCLRICSVWQDREAHACSPVRGLCAFGLPPASASVGGWGHLLPARPAAECTRSHIFQHSLRVGARAVGRVDSLAGTAKERSLQQRPAAS